MRIATNADFGQMHERGIAGPCQSRKLIDGDDDAAARYDSTALPGSKKAAYVPVIVYVTSPLTEPRDRDDVGCGLEGATAHVFT